MSEDGGRRTETGTVTDSAVVPKRTWYGGEYRVWNCQVVPRGANADPVNVRVGEWFIGAIHKTAEITAEGAFHGQGVGRGYIQADTITDQQSHARFTERGAAMNGGPADITGQVTLLEPLVGEDGQIGYAFNVLDDSNKVHSVVMRGRKCVDVVVKGNRVRVVGVQDAGGVIHTRKIEDLSTSREVEVTGRPGPRRWPRLVSAIIAAVFAAVPWVVGITLEFDDNVFLIFAVVWTLICLAAVATMTWAFFRTGHRT